MYIQGDKTLMTICQTFVHIVAGDVLQARSFGQ